MSLHGQIMNLPCDTSMMPVGHGYVTAYKIGHRDARHAAAELAVAVEQQRDELLAFFKRLRGLDAFSSVLYGMRGELDALIAKAEAQK